MVTDANFPPDFLQTALRTRHDESSKNRPYVTLTFAQSLDAKIAGKHGKQLILSGQESMLMTHWMRSMHDAILIGIGTALNDNPQLNVRYLPPTTNGLRRHLPRPIILDAELRFSPNAKLLQNFNSSVGRRPWIICAKRADDGDQPRIERKGALEAVGARIIEVAAHFDTVDSSSPGLLPLRAVLAELRSNDVRSLMVEGGASIIRSFLAEISSVDSVQEGCVDTVIITTAPVFVGEDGVGYDLKLDSISDSTFKYLKTEPMGRDTVVGLAAMY